MAATPHDCWYQSLSWSDLPPYLNESSQSLTNSSAYLQCNNIPKEKIACPKCAPHWSRIDWLSYFAITFAFEVFALPNHESTHEILEPHLHLDKLELYWESFCIDDEFHQPSQNGHPLPHYGCSHETAQSWSKQISKQGLDPSEREEKLKSGQSKRLWHSINFETRGYLSQSLQPY